MRTRLSDQVEKLESEAAAMRSLLEQIAATFLNERNRAVLGETKPGAYLLFVADIWIRQLQEILPGVDASGDALAAARELEGKHDG